MKDRINEILNFLEKLEKEGGKQISISEIKAIIQGVILDPGGGDISNKREETFELEVFRSTNEAGAAALKSAIIINGGAAVALLALFGSLLSYRNSVDLSFIGFALLAFVFGVGFAGASSGITYLSQFYNAKQFDKYAAKNGNHMDTWWGKKSFYDRADFCNRAAIILGIGSYVLFFSGGVFSYIGVM